MKKRSTDSLRRQAEKRLAVTERQIESLDLADLTYLAHELAVKQTTIEIQNEELRQARFEAEVARDRYYELFDFAPVGHFTLNQSNRITEVNRAGCQLLRIEKPDALKKRFTSFLAHGQPKHFREFREHILESGNHESLEIRLKDMEGTLLSARLEGLQGEDGMLRVSAIDITSHKQAEYELKRYGEHLEQLVRERTKILVQSEDRYHSLVDNIEDMVYSLDAKGRFTIINNTTREALALSEENIIGKNHRDLGFPDDVVRKWNAMHRQVISGHTVTSEIQMPMPDGRSHLFEIRLSPLRDETGQVTGCTGVTHDVTEIRQAREALRQLSIRLLQTQEKERRAIGEVLHDELGASLTMLNLSLHQMKKYLNPEIDLAVKEIEDIVREIIEQVRSLSHSLRPSVLDQFGILEALQWNFQRFEAKTGFSVTFSPSESIFWGSNPSPLSSIQRVQIPLSQHITTSRLFTPEYRAAFVSASWTIR